MPVRGLRSKAYQEAKAVYYNSFPGSEWERYLPGGHMEIYNALFVPLIIDDEIIGLMGFANKEGGFNDNDSELASVFSEFAAIALLNSKIFDSLMKSEERFYKIFNASPSLLSIRLLENWQFFDVNESWLHHMGYLREEVIGCTSEKLNFDVNPLTEDKKRQIIYEGGIFNQEYKYRKKSGEERFGLVSANIFEIAGDKYILTEIRDVTELKQMEAEMARLERLNLVGEMAASIGHEIRNPMTVVMGLLQVLGSKKEFLSYKDYFNIMIDELSRANSIITEFLTLARNRPVDLKTVNLKTIINAISPLVKADAMNLNMEVMLELEEVPDLLLDEKEIRQLILNLVRNGLEAMPLGGNIRIRTFLDCEEIVLSVQDQGKGIDPNFIDKIGTPFFTTKENGTGLGLAVCYGIAVRHNAVVKMETGSGGTVFYVRFKKSQT